MKRRSPLAAPGEGRCLPHVLLRPGQRACPPSLAAPLLAEPPDAKSRLGNRGQERQDPENAGWRSGEDDHVAEDCEQSKQQDPKRKEPDGLLQHAYQIR